MTRAALNCQLQQIAATAIKLANSDSKYYRRERAQDIKSQCQQLDEE
jgi:hypothetical protein